MPRKEKQRKIFLPSKVKGFTAIGNSSDNFINLNLDELEAIKLLDYENLTQQEVSKIMEVSRPTLTRIYDRARKKVAKALVEGQNIQFSGGNIFIDKNWYYCSICNISFNHIDTELSCPICNSEKKITNYCTQLKVNKTS